MRAKVIAAVRMKDAVAIGKSTKADVIAALGETLVISFDTGYEVWVYRLADDANAIETWHSASVRSRPDKRVAAHFLPVFVILFAPSGVVAKPGFVLRRTLRISRSAWKP